MAKDIKEPDKLNNEVLEDAEIEALYKASLEAEVPDFWDKIEAGIKAEVKADNAPSQAQAAGGNVVSFETAKQKAEDKRNDKAVKTKRYMRPYMGLIAAAVLMIIIAVPIFILGLGDRKKLENEKKADATTTAEFSMDNAMSDSSAKAEAAAETDAAAGAVAESAEAPAMEETTTQASLDEDYAESYEDAAEDAEENSDRGKDELNYKINYKNGISSADAKKIVIIRGEVVLKGDKYIFRDIKNETETVKLDKDEYEVENPEDLVRCMEEYDGEIVVWVCALHGDKLYVYGPAED